MKGGIAGSTKIANDHFQRTCRALSLQSSLFLDFRMTESWGESNERGLTCQNREGGGGRGGKTLHSLNIPDTELLSIFYSII